jgi:hypothetical protein
MNSTVRRYAFMIGVATAAWVCNGQVSPTQFSLVATAEAVVGAPATPVSYAGVARRSTVGAGSPGVGVTPGVGVGAPGVGATPAPGVNTPANQGGPVNRVGRR